MAKQKTEAMQILDECPCAGGHLDKFIQAAMLSVLAGEPLHGYRIMQRLRLMPMFQNHTPDPTGVYRLLRAMEDRKLVTCEWNMPDRGPAKKQFRITDRGIECLSKWIGTLEDYSSKLNDLLAALKAGPAKAPAAKTCACRKAQPKVIASQGREI